MKLQTKQTARSKPTAAKSASPRRMKRARVLKDIYRDRYLYLLLLPFLLYYAIFIFKPMGGLIIAFKDYSVFKGVAKSPWVGFKHFKLFFESPYFFRTLKNTLLINILSLLFAFPAPIILAILLNEVRQKRLKKTIQTLTYMPYFISTVVVVGIVTNLLSPSHGLITFAVEKITGEKPYYLMYPQYFRTIFITMQIWQSVGYNSVVYLAALSGINTELYEAAAIDGAGKLKQIWNITIPGILPTIMVMLILRIGSMLSLSTDAILLLYQPSTYEVSDVIGTYVYRMGITGTNYSLATAVDLFNSIIALILVWGANTISKKVTEEGIW